MSEPTIVACATALPAAQALLRLSGPHVRTIVDQLGLSLPSPWQVVDVSWPILGGACPAKLCFMPAGRSYSGEDLLEIVVPGSADLVAALLRQLEAAGAEAAGPGAFTRQALANGRLDLDQVAAVLAVTQAGDAAAAQRALMRLRGALATDLQPVRKELIHLRALVEAGLDFADEDDVRAYEPQALQERLGELRAIIGRWLRAADQLEQELCVCLAGPANAGKSALFSRLTGSQALVSPIAGTTRDWLTADWTLPGGREVTLIDTAGTLDQLTQANQGLDAAGIAAGQQRLQGAALVLFCSAPDAPLPAGYAEVLGDGGAHAVIATKADLGDPDARASLMVCSQSGEGLEALAGLVAARLNESAGEDPRQQQLLQKVDQLLLQLQRVLPEDELLAADLRQAADHLADLLGVTTPDDVLDVIFSSFCIGK